ncbi:MAG: diaminopimelate epimerase [Cyclobacteriaceae bacterium]
MTVTFHKYQGTGNDFVMIDDRAETFPRDNKSLIAHLCDRKMGIGADGVILIQNHPDVDFRMIYFNPDGSESLCGNGSRCAIAFASSLGMISDKTTFETTDGVHDAFMEDDIIHFHLYDVKGISQYENDWYINTGSPHHVRLVEDLEEMNIVTPGREIRESEHYAPKGTNVNFVQKLADGISVRTYERGVEDETLSCGTGVTACALVANLLDYESPVSVKTKGGNLTVSYTVTGDQSFENIYLAGPAKKVFEGTMEV